MVRSGYGWAVAWYMMRSWKNEGDAGVGTLGVVVQLWLECDGDPTPLAHCLRVMAPTNTPAFFVGTSEVSISPFEVVVIVEQIPKSLS